MGRTKKLNNIIMLDDHAEIIIASKRYGIKHVLVDLDDVCNVSERTWGICKSKTSKYKDMFYVASHSPKFIQLHRFLTSNNKGLVVDHINRNTLDNRKNNLRVVSQQENSFNNTGYHSSTTNIRGVSYDKTRNKYIAHIGINRKSLNLGRFDSINDAIRVRNLAEKRLHKIGA